MPWEELEGLLQPFMGSKTEQWGASLSIGAAAAHSLAAVVLSQRWENGGGVN